MTAGSFQTGKKVVTQNPHFFQPCRKPSLSPQEAVLFPSGEGRKWETWKTYCQLIYDALGHPEDGSQGLLVQIMDII